MADPSPTDIAIRVISSDAKVIGALVGDCRVTLGNRRSREVLSEGFHQGGSGDTEAIMKHPRQRGAIVFATDRRRQ